MEVKKVEQGSERKERVVGKSNKNSVLAVYVWWVEYGTKY